MKMTTALVSLTSRSTSFERACCSTGPSTSWTTFANSRLKSSPKSTLPRLHALLLLLLLLLLILLLLLLLLILLLLLQPAAASSTRL